jgi:hypothetical protein
MFVFIGRVKRAGLLGGSIRHRPPDVLAPSLA